MLDSYSRTFFGMIVSGVGNSSVRIADLFSKNCSCLLPVYKRAEGLIKPLTNEIHARMIVDDSAPFRTSVGLLP
jgi:hypothetical protein